MLTEEEIVTVHKGIKMKITKVILIFWYISYRQEVKNVNQTAWVQNLSDLPFTSFVTLSKCLSASVSKQKKSIRKGTLIGGCKK